MSELTTENISIMSYLKVFFRRKELFIIPVFAGLILGICTGLVLPKKYRSSTVILIEEGKTDNPLFNNIAVSTTVTQRLTAVKESMLGWNNLVQLVKRLNLDKDVKSVGDFEKLILDIRKDIIIMARGTNIIDLSYVGGDAKQTKDVVENITNIFIEKNVQQQNQETADAITFIEGLLKVYRGKIKSAEIAKLQDELDAMLVDSTEMHPRVKQLREAITAQKKELEEQNLEYSADASLGSATNPIIDEIKKAIETMETKKTASPTTAQTAAANSKDMYKVMLIDKLDSVMARDVGVSTQIYNMLLQRLETAKITHRLQSSKEGTKYTILDPPRIPLEPFYPNKLLMAFMGLFVGALLGAGLVVASEFLDKSFLDVEEAKNYLGMPLLGAISKINTEESIRSEKERQRWVYSLTLLVGIVVVIVTIGVSNLIQ